MLCNPQNNFAYIIAFDPKDPREADRATGFISASQMKEMRLRETKGFCSTARAYKRPEPNIQSKS